MPDVLRVTSSCAIPLRELEWRTSTPGGPGGQHANTTRSRVEVRFDVASSPSLGPRQRQRLLDAYGPVMRASAAEHRSQHRNREVALERLRERLAAGLANRATRRPTRPTRAAREGRLANKRRRGEIKAARRPPPDER